MASNMSIADCIWGWILFAIWCSNIKGSLYINNKSENSNSSKQGIQDCKVSEHGNYECYIGSKILSRTETFYKVIEQKADANKLIILAVVDFQFLDMTIHLYEHSLRPLSISNHLFICSNENAFKDLQLRNINSILYGHNV